MESPTLADAFYEVTGIALKGSKAERRAAVKEAANNFVNRQRNIDNGNVEAYNTNNSNAENNVGGMPDVAGSSVEADSGRVPGVYQTSDTEHQGRGGLGEVSERSGLVLLSQQAKDTLAKRGVAVVETQDVSNDKPAFSAALSAARNSDSAHGWAVTPKSIEELEESGARLIMAANGTTGLAVTSDGDIEAVFANKAAGAPKGATKTTIPQAIANGGTKLDCYGKDLVWLYAQYGFVPVARVKFNAEYANPGWDASKGEPDIFFLMHNGDSADTVVEKNGTYEKLTAEELNALPVMEYDEAYKYRDSLLADRQAANERKNTASTQETESSAVNDDPATHTAEEMSRIEEYKAAVDENLVNYIETVKNNPGAKLGRYALKPVSDRAASDIKALTGVDVSGNKTAIEPRTVEHILRRHGENGRANNSMSDTGDIARMQYVLDNYDSIEEGGRSSAYQTVKPNGKPGQAKTVVFSKAVDGTYYVVEAVPDTKAKTVFIVSAYLSNKKTGDMQTADAEASRFTSETKNAQSPVKSDDISSDTSIPATQENVNGNFTLLLFFLFHKTKSWV